MDTVSKQIREDNLKYIVNEIKFTCNTFGDREAGSASEKKAIDHMAEELKKYTDDVKVEPFEVHPLSFLGWLPFTATCAWLGALAYFFIPLLGLLFVVAGLAVMLFQFVWYGEVFDKLFPKRTSHNITAVKKPVGETKRRILFNGHPDAAWEWPLVYYGGDALNSAVVITAIVGAFYTIAISIASMVIEGGVVAGIAEGVSLYMGLAGLICVPGYIGLYFFINFRRITPGANDNLTACYMSIALIKALEEAGIKLENTEIGALITGSEEAGTRGSRAWAKAHKGEYQDAETIIITMETLRELEHLTIYHKDLNGLVPTDPGVCKLLKEAGADNGMDIRYFPVTIGATDAVSFTRGGFRSACLGGLDHKLQRYYHTREDACDNLNEECLAKVMDIMLTAIDKFDKAGA